MTKLSERTDDELSELMNKYKSKIQKDPGNEEYQKKYKKIEKEISKRTYPDKRVKAGTGVERVRVQKMDFFVGTSIQRFVARLIDGFIAFGFFMPLAFYVFTHEKYDIALSSMTGTMLTVLGMGLSFLYEPLCLIIFSSTPGKMSLGLKVVTVDGDNLSIKHAFVRSISYYLISVFAGLLFYVFAFMSSQRRQLADFISGTRVVRVPGQLGTTEVKKRYFVGIIFILLSLPSIYQAGESTYEYIVGTKKIDQLFKNPFLGALEEAKKMKQLK